MRPATSRPPVARRRTAPRLRPRGRSAVGILPASHASPNIDRQHQVVPMKVGVARESAAGERRVALVPELLGKLTAAGLEILVEQGAGSGAAFPAPAFAAPGPTI